MDKCLYTNKRFLITEDAVNEQGIMARTMAYLNKLYVDTPVGADIFKVAGGGQNYVHGGTSLQEMIVPVIELTTNTRGVLDWFAADGSHNIVYTSHNEKQNKDVYMVALRDEGELIGYYEKHEYRNAETMKPYDLW